MRSHHTHHHHHALARTAHHHVVQHAAPAGPGGAWYVRAIESFSHFSVGWLLGGMGYLLGRLWLPVGLIAAGALAVLVGRVWGRHRLAAAGSCWELHLGEQVSRAALEAFTRTLAGGLPRRLFGASPWVTLSVSSLEDRATCGLFISGGLSPAQVRASVEQALGSVTVQPEDATPAAGGGEARFRVASLAPVGSRFLPLRVDHRVDPAGQLLASLRAQEASEGGVVQLVLQAPPRSASAKARGQAARLRSGRGLEPSVSLRALQAVASLLGEMLDMFTPGSPHPMSRPAATRSADPFSLERARAIDAKAGTPLLAATLRVGAWAIGRRRACGRLGGLLAALGQYQELGGLRRSWEPFCAARLKQCLPPVKPRLLLGSGEAAALIPVPEESGVAPLSFSEAPSRRVAPVAQAPSCGLLLGRSDHAGFDREVRIEPKALLQHTHVLGPTGRGKSTLLLNMTVEAIRAGMGGIVLDPTGELTENILTRIPRERQEDVDLLDLGDEAHPPALNLLACPAGEGDAQAQAICGIFARLFARFWGPRTEDILRSALTTLLVGRDPAGPAPTLADVLTLLIDPGERSRYRASDPVALDVFWRQWQTLSEPARVQALAPLSNKLRALLGNRALRNMLCQPAAPDMRERIKHGRWLLVSLPQTIGEDAADLIGSVLLHRAWQAAQRLGPLAFADRPPFLCLIDECHRFCHLPQGMATALAQARGYGLGLVLAHQHLAQVADHELDEAIDANCQTKICFALAAADAKRMAPHFQPRLDARDLQHLGSYTIACRILHDARELPAATATTLPPPKLTPGDTAGAIRQRARAHASERRAVEATIRDRYGRIEQSPPGRVQADELDREPLDVDRSQGAPLDAPFDAPSDGAPPPPATPHHDRDLRPHENPDNDQYFPSVGRRL
jgi:TraM recognition site of TraD and TraG